MSSLRGSPIKRLQFFNREPTSQVLSLQAEIQRLSSQVHLKNVQIKQLYDENKLLRVNYQEQIISQIKTIQLLEQQIAQLQKTRSAEFDIIKQKYQSDNNGYHAHQVQFLMKQIASLRVDCATRDQKIMIKDKQIVSITQSFQRELEDRITEINSLNKMLLSIEESKNREIRDMASKRELEKSRNSGVMSSRKQNNNFMDKQMRKLNEEVLEKAIKVQNLNRQLNKNKRRAQETQKALNKKMEQLIIEREEEAKQRQYHFAKIQKSLKQQILQFKSRQLKYLGEIDTLKSTIQVLQTEIKRHLSTISSKQQQIIGYKQMLQRQREDHAKQISNLIKERRKRSSQLGSSRSLGSSMKDTSGAGNQQSVQIPHVNLQKKDSVRLATVKEESPDKSLSRSMERSNLTEEPVEEQNQIMKIIMHYDTLIEELKKSHISQLQLLKHKLQKTTRNLDQKQQQMLDMLTRFSPLVKIHAEEKTLEEDRRDRIDRHWKADLALLSIMLDKYRIQTYV